MNETTITPDPSKRYLVTEPFFIESTTGEVHILREAGFWDNPTGGK